MFQSGEQNAKKELSSVRPLGLHCRLWLFVLQKVDISPERKWGEWGSTGLNKIINILCNDEYRVHGKGQFRDEFVTCGGVALDSINSNTMESLHCPGLYFAGKCLILMQLLVDLICKLLGLLVMLRHRQLLNF